MNADNTNTSWVTPLGREAYYGLAGAITSTVAPYTEADPSAILLQLLAGFGNVIGHKPHYLVEQTRHHTNLFVVVIGQTAKARKGTSWGHVSRLLAAADPEWSGHCVQQASPTGEGLMWALRDAVYRHKNGMMELADPGVQDKRLMLSLGEFASVLTQCRRPSSTLSSVLRNGWDNGHLVSMTKKCPVKVTSGHISIAAHIVRDELKKTLKGVDINNGLANRILFCCARRTQLLPDGGQPPEHEMLLLSHQLYEAASWTKQVDRVIRDSDADELWRAVYPELSRDRAGVVDAVCSRAEAQVTRLAMVYALLDKRAVIEVPHLRAALAVWAYCEQSAQFVFDDLRQAAPLADIIYGALLQHPAGLDRTQIHGLFSRNRQAADIAEAVLELTLAGKVRSTRVPSTTGRPSEVIMATDGMAQRTNELTN
jgi:hypothetical protein